MQISRNGIQQSVANTLLVLHLTKTCITGNVNLEYTILKQILLGLFIIQNIKYKEKR